MTLDEYEQTYLSVGLPFDEGNLKLFALTREQAFTALEAINKTEGIFLTGLSIHSRNGAVIEPVHDYYTSSIKDGTDFDKKRQDSVAGAIDYIARYPRKDVLYEVSVWDLPSRRAYRDRERARRAEEEVQRQSLRERGYDV